MNGDIVALPSLKSSAGACLWACKGVSDELEELELNNGSPFAYIASKSTIDPGGCVCVRAIVPLRNNMNGTIEYRPIAGWPEDSIMVDLAMVSSEDPLYKDARVTVPVDMQRKQMADRYYEGVAQLYDPGIYQLDARLEYRNGQWNANPGQPMVPYMEQPIEAGLRSKVHVRLDHRHTTHVARHQELPLCVVGDAPGRWIPETNLPHVWLPSQYMSAVEDSRVWLPYHCRLRRISHSEFAYRMSQKYPSVHWYGDSNSRRTLRPFIMGGKWCHEANTTTRLDCLCNDAPKDLYPTDWYARMPIPRWYRIHGTGVNGSEIFADHRRKNDHAPNAPPVSFKADALRATYVGPDYVPHGYESRTDYFDLYYLFTRGTLDMYGSHWARDISANAVSAYPPASLVVVQLITWDVAFGDYTPFTRHVEQMARRLRAVYPHSEFIYRSGPYWCCRAAETDDKKYSRLRFLAFDRYARQVFRKQLGARVWDVMTVQASRAPESKRLEENMPCLSAHTRGEHIHLDNQLLMNMIVNSVAEGF
ncbi:hypothetical protein IW140_006136 [Coemansia sp. RSA 1813]|nr:hypothetical protein EV178_006162 [Coemansia sp. RSA 1646]KAJ1767161.1 hypothetical protein LPJ74_005524 [Coemansia sp. RSA 1843]KAJ2085759.1 hypothetical protein IW138_006126 [Coemansia sp. RSA 986]KAJ2210631.1 hypothetical protein EV179_006098 [Coemansia sp. RSA 487]KAJ2563376.1 hypothetical protein IW140_006136 [Coemansia sp. RSA 1813]